MSKSKITLFITIPVVLIIIVTAAIIFSSTTPAKTVPTAASHISLAEKYLLDLNYEAAIAEYRAAIVIDPKNADYYIALADIYTQMGDIPGAIAVLDEALAAVDEIDWARIREAIDRLSPNTIEEIDKPAIISASGAIQFPETATPLSRGDYFTVIDSETGDVLLNINKKDSKYTEQNLDRFITMVYGFAKFRRKDYSTIYIDSKGDIFDRNTPGFADEFLPPPDIATDFPYIKNGLYIFKNNESYGVKTEDGTVILEAKYKYITPDENYTYFGCYDDGLIITDTSGKIIVSDTYIYDVIFDKIPGYAILSNPYYNNNWGDIIYNLTTGEEVENLNNINSNVVYSTKSLSREYIHIYDPEYALGYSEEGGFRVVPWIKYYSEDSEEFYGCRLVNYKGDVITDKRLDYDPIIYSDNYFSVSYSGYDENNEYSNGLLIYDYDGLLIHNFEDFRGGSVQPIGDKYVVYGFKLLCDKIIYGEGLLVNFKGTVLAEYNKTLTPFCGDSLIFCEKNSGLWGIIRDGEIVIPCEYTNIRIADDAKKIIEFENNGTKTYMLAETLTPIEIPVD
jgi:tetratricopeptide (TPR) repeat protein